MAFDNQPTPEMLEKLDRYHTEGLALERDLHEAAIAFGTGDQALDIARLDRTARAYGKWHRKPRA